MSDATPSGAHQTVTPTVDLDACNGHGRCYMTAPAIFDCDDDGYPVVLAPAATADEVRELERAVANCPEKAIAVSRS